LAVFFFQVALDSGRLEKYYLQLCRTADWTKLSGIFAAFMVPRDLNGLRKPNRYCMSTRFQLLPRVEFISWGRSGGNELGNSVSLIAFSICGTASGQKCFATFRSISAPS
jgi:hypothetical protein